MSIEMKPSLYLETTIPSYLVARMSNDIRIAGKQAVTHDFWELERYKYDLYVSYYVIGECGKGDSKVAKKRLSLIDGIQILAETPDVEPLANTFMLLLSIPQRSRVDALHLAICCIYEIDILLTWNCSHLSYNNIVRMKKHNDAHGLSTPQMLTPDNLTYLSMEVDF